MSVREGPHQLIADLHGDLREISALMCVQAARAPRKRNIIDGTQAKKLILLDGAYNISRHITVISSNQIAAFDGHVAEIVRDCDTDSWATSPRSWEIETIFSCFPVWSGRPKFAVCLKVLLEFQVSD